MDKRHAPDHRDHVTFMAHRHAPVDGTRLTREEQERLDALRASYPLDELGDALLHLHRRGWLRFGRDAAGALYFQTRMDLRN